MTDCCKYCDGWPDEGYCKAQGQCGCHTPMKSMKCCPRCNCDGPYTCKEHDGEFAFCTNGLCLCHTPEKPAQERNVVDAGVRPDGFTIADKTLKNGFVGKYHDPQEKDGGHTCNGTVCDCLLRRAQEECCELCEIRTKDGTSHYCANSRCTCHETNKPPIEEDETDKGMSEPGFHCICDCHETKKPPTSVTASEHLTGDTDSIHEEWETEFAQLISECIFSHYDGEPVKKLFAFIRNLVKQLEAAEKERYKTKVFAIEFGALEERARIKKVIEGKIGATVEGSDTEDYKQGLLKGFNAALTLLLSALEGEEI